VVLIKKYKDNFIYYYYYNEFIHKKFHSEIIREEVNSIALP